MKGKVVLLTGSTAGIGKQAARALVAKGASLVCVARSEAKAQELVAELRAQGGEGCASYLIGDMSRPAEVARVAEEFLQRHDRLDVLFNNAGALFASRQLTPDGLERTFALNHMGYFVLTVKLLERLKASGGARVVSTASAAHSSGDLAFLEDLQTEAWRPGGMRAYGRSKLANIWFTVELARRLEGSGVTANCFHPGFVASEFARGNGVLFSIGMTLLRPFARTVVQGADTGVWLATSDEVAGESGGYYFERRRRQGTRAARDPDAPARLWRESERIAASILGDDWLEPGQPPR